MQFVVSNTIRVFDPNEKLIKWCREKLVIDNPEYEKKLRIGKWLGNTSKKISLYETVGNEIHIPFGCFRELYSDFHDKTLFKAYFRPIQRVFYDSRIKLYDYQEEATNKALKAKNGVIVMPCGSGKTQTALEIVNRIGGRCLWLTHTQDLLNQSMTRAKSCFGLPLEDYGTITEGKVDIKKITFATVQTMCRIDLRKHRYDFDVVVVDECHKCVGSPTNVMQFYKVLSNIGARYKYGLTATPKRADGLEKSMFALLGDIIIEIPKSVVEETTCTVETRQIETGYTPDLDVVLSGDGTINYSSLIDDLVHNKERFDVILEMIDSLPDGNPALILGNRVEYLERLNEACSKKSICLSGLGASKRAKQERKEALEKLNIGDLDCVFATYQLAKEGLDVPNLRYVIFATPEKDETTVTQASGRVGRKADGKDKGIVIDFVDNFGMYRGWAKKRANIYKKLKYILT